MNKVFIFDVDGTLTPSRRKMTKEFQKFFKEWVKKNKFYLVTGSDLPKLQEQMDYLDIEAEGIFTCCGNQMWRDDELIYDNKFELTSKLKNALEVILMSSQYPHRYGNHIEDRGSMLNFSVVGRNCNLEQRQHYFEWDTEKGERKKLSLFIKHKFPELDAVIGGQISIDIAPKGNDKSQVIDIIKQDYIPHVDEYIFIGDRTMEGGNDYPLAKVMKEMDNCEVYQAGEPSAEDGYKSTQKILEKLID